MDTVFLDSTIVTAAAENGPVVVALSGGVDSSLVAFRAHILLGDKVEAVTISSALIPARERERATAIARHIGIQHSILPIDLLEDKDVRANKADRCYHCKRRILGSINDRYGRECVIMDGTNGDDDPTRPGLRALAEFGAISPLRVSGWTKTMVRHCAREFGLPNWDTPSESCLAARIPHGTPLDQVPLQQVEILESFFHENGIPTLRVYLDNLVATVEHESQYADIVDKIDDNLAALIKQIGLRSYRCREWTP